MFGIIYPLFSSTEEAIMETIKCGGDTDTNASIIGELMNYKFNDLTQKEIDFVNSKIDDFMIDIIKEFNEEF